MTRRDVTEIRTGRQRAPRNGPRKRPFGQASRRQSRHAARSATRYRHSQILHFLPGHQRHRELPRGTSARGLLPAVRGNQVTPRIRHLVAAWLVEYPGSGRTPAALWQNLWLGGKPRHANAHLLIAQAQYFLSIKRRVLAQSCLEQAAQFAEGRDAETLASLRQSLGAAFGGRTRNDWAFTGIPAHMCMQCRCC